MMGAVGINEYQLVSKSSEVYGETIDVMTDDTELCSAAMGPHPLDNAWGIGFLILVAASITYEGLAQR